MGELNIQIKVLKGNAPILFTWLNKEMDTANACLITCSCQNLDLQENIKAAPKRGRPVKGLQNAITTESSINLCKALENAEIVSIQLDTEGESVLQELETITERMVTKLSRSKGKKKKASGRRDGKLQDADCVVLDSPECVDIDSQMENDTYDIFDESRELEGDQLHEQDEDDKIDEEGRMSSSDEGGVDEEARLDEYEYDQREEGLAMEDLDKQSELERNEIVTSENIDNRDHEFQQKVIVLSNVEHKSDGNASLLRNPVNQESQDCNGEEGICLAAVNNPIQSIDHAQTDCGLEVSHIELGLEKPLVTATLDGQIIDIPDATHNPVVVLQEGREPISDVDRAFFEALKGFIESQAEEAKEEGQFATVSNPNNSSLTEQDVTDPIDPLLQPNPIYAINTPAMVKYREHRNKLFLKKLHQTTTGSSSCQTTICEICGSILSVKQIKKHLQSIHSTEERVRNHECQTCGKKFFKTDSLVRHERTHYEPSFKCEYCDKRFRHNFQLLNHARIHMGYDLPKRIHKPRYKTLNPKPRQSSKNLEADDVDQVAACEVCGSKMNVKSIRRHMLMKHADVEIGSHHCNKCERKFSTASRLKTHLLTHDGLRFRCSFCNIVSLDDLTRVKHERSHLPEEPRQGSVKYKCGYCDKQYSRVRDRLQQEMSHFDSSIDLSHGTRKRKFYKPPPKLVNCAICNKTLKQTSMKCHMDSHSGKTWTCDVCGKTISKGARYDHLKLHGNKKEHACSHCSSKFHTKHGLVAHLRKHTKEKPIPCRYCDRMFSRYEGRNNHERSHTGERPYRCDLCEKTWKDRPTYAQHMKKHHPGMPLMLRKRRGSALLPNLPGVIPS